MRDLNSYRPGGYVFYPRWGTDSTSGSFRPNPVKRSGVLGSASGSRTYGRIGCRGVWGGLLSGSRAGCRLGSRLGGSVPAARAALVAGRSAVQDHATSDLPARDSRPSTGTRSRGGKPIGHSSRRLPGPSPEMSVGPTSPDPGHRTASLLVHCLHLLRAEDTHGAPAQPPVDPRRVTT